ncbi:lantibiotic dehydratase [Micromonospora sp. NPDC048999]|uniref:lantibiotic dehydratase n=1 Tax=Micromonospora sp. NPDC048999 TaxID=3155391 RepID=UPI0033FE106C
MSAEILLGDGQWRLWPQFALRGPGFPAAGVLRLAPLGLADAADRFTPGQRLSGTDWDEFLAGFAEAAVRTAHELQDVAGSERFQAAVAWQNPALLRTGIEPFLNWSPTAAGRTSMPRQREELVAHYWQRFCVKNDTIGFFGPVGWGELDPGRPGLTVTAGTGLVAESNVYFSSWAIDALAKAISAEADLREWIPPRRMSFVRATEDSIVVPGRPAQPVDPLHRAVFVRCDGVRQVAELATEVSAELRRTVTVVELVEVLEQLAAKRWIGWRLEVAADAYPERHLRAVLDQIGDPGLRDRALAKLDALEHARDRVRAAGQDTARVRAAVTALEDTFTELTCSPTQREKSTRTASCRALVYQDCRRSATAVVGASILDELAPLGLCLTAARWMTARFAEFIGARLRTVYDDLVARTGPVDLGTLWLACLPVPHPEAAEGIAAIQAELRERWAKIVAAPPGARRVQLAWSDIAGEVEAAFGEADPGWGLARYVSPDVIISAPSTDAVERGDFELVLGELHLALNTIGASLFVRQHPDPAALLAETTRDFPDPRILPMLPKEQLPRWSARSQPTLVRPEDYYLGLVDHTADPRRPRAVMSADVPVHDRDGRLVVVLPDGAQFDLLEVFGWAMTNRVLDRFNLRPDADHSPRVTIDRMVVTREAWRFGAATLEFADERDEARRFVRARWWRTESGLPRFVFVVLPGEPRPFFVDFDAPVYVNILAKAVRRLARKDPDARLSVTEMLPTPEQTWLTDDAGDRYTSELRLVAVHQSP